MAPLAPAAAPTRSGASSGGRSGSDSKHEQMLPLKEQFAVHRLTQSGWRHFVIDVKLQVFHTVK